MTNSHVAMGTAMPIGKMRKSTKRPQMTFLRLQVLVMNLGINIGNPDSFLPRFPLELTDNKKYSCGLPAYFY